MSAVMHEEWDRNVEQLRVPPHYIEGEQAVLGGLMLAPESLAKVSDWLTPEDFYRRDHARIYAGILALSGKDKPFDAVTLGDWFEGEGESDLIGGTYLVELASTTPSAANIVAYAEIVHDKAKLRKVIEIGTGLVNRGFTPGGRDTDEIISEGQYDLTHLRGDPRAGGLVASSSTLKDWFDDLQDRFKRGDGVTGLPYPWKAVNDVTHGLQPGELTIIAARPSMGKSVMGLNLALFSSMRGTNTAFFSLEMTHRQVNRRNVASLGEVDHDWLLSPDESRDDLWTKVTPAVRDLKTASLLVDESAGLRIEQIVARARRAHMQKPIELLVLDHLHDLNFPGKRDMRHEVGAAAAAMKALAKEFNCPVVVIAQLSRKVEDRTSKRPIMSDLRESGEIEQKADVIWLLYNDDYYQRNEDSYAPNHVIELILAKGRDLKAGKPVVLRERFDVMKLVDWEGHPPARKEPEKRARGMSAGSYRPGGD